MRFTPLTHTPGRKYRYPPEALFETGLTSRYPGALKSSVFLCNTQFVAFRLHALPIRCGSGNEKTKPNLRKRKVVSAGTLESAPCGFSLARQFTNAKRLRRRHRSAIVTRRIGVRGTRRRRNRPALVPRNFDRRRHRGGRPRRILIQMRRMQVRSHQVDRRRPVMQPCVFAARAIAQSHDATVRTPARPRRGSAPPAPDPKPESTSSQHFAQTSSNPPQREILSSSSTAPRRRFQHRPSQLQSPLPVAPPLAAQSKRSLQS